MRDALTVLDDVRGRAIAGDTAPLPGLVDELEVSILVAPEFSAESLSAVRDLFRMEAFVALQDSWRLLRFIDNNWEMLSPSQREEIRGMVVDAFDELPDWMGAFVAAEMLGRRYGDRDALDSLGRLGRSARLPARSLVPHGLETLAREGKDSEVRAAATQQLRALTTSSIEAVRSEAAEALARIEGKPEGSDKR